MIPANYLNSKKFKNMYEEYMEEQQQKQREERRSRLTLQEAYDTQFQFDSTKEVIDSGIKHDDKRLIGDEGLISKEDAICKIIKQIDDASYTDLICILKILNCGTYDVCDDEECDDEEDYEYDVDDLY